MVDEVTVRTAAETAWSIFRAKHPGVDASDSRRCLLDRHLEKRGREPGSDAEELASFGLAYLHRLPADEC